ncbi:MAG: hypothetical protein ACQ9MH_14180 [Nitrospinales bacterium]
MKRWSKLKKNIESFFADDLPLVIHCTDVNRVTGNPFGYLGKLRIQFGKEVLWSFPNDFITNDKSTWPEVGPMSYTASNINRIIREYIDTPKSELLEKEFQDDLFKITDIFKAADKRISFDRLQNHFDSPQSVPVQTILHARALKKSANLLP